VFLIEP